MIEEGRYVDDVNDSEVGLRSGTGSGLGMGGKDVEGMDCFDWKVRKRGFQVVVGRRLQ